MAFQKINMEKSNLLCYNHFMREYKETLHSLTYKSNSDLSLYSAGYEQCSSGYEYGPKFRAYDLIHFVLSGKGELHIDEHIFSLSAGDVFIIPAGKIAYYKASQTHPWSYAWVGFLGISSKTYIYQLMSSTKKIYILNNIDTKKYKDCIFDILSLENNTTYDYLKANSILLNIIAMLFDDINFDESNWGKASIADEVKFYLDTNYAEKLKITDVARFFGIHPNYLTRIFHDKFGVSPKQYLTDLKLNKSRKLLVTTESSVSVIANSLGFEDQLAFSKVFKKHFSLSPSEYRKKTRMLATDSKK